MEKGSKPNQPAEILAELISSQSAFRLADLTRRLSELRDRNDIAGAIPLQLELIHVLEQTGYPRGRRASANNYLSQLYMKSGSLAKAELYARQAIDLAPGDDTPERHFLAGYLMNLARILSLQERRSEAIPFAEGAVKEWTNIVNRRGQRLVSIDFLRARQDELQSIRAGTWKDT
jgi:tetratricopeptide (TPR) repeat protein